MDSELKKGGDMHRGCQSLYSKNGEYVFEGEWNPRVLLDILKVGGDDWGGKRVLDIGANTGGLTLEIARLGAKVVAAEPDPYKNNMGLTKNLLLDTAKDEGLDISIVKNDLFSCHELGEFDIILCFGLAYHFRYFQYLLDYISSLKPAILYISCQTHPSDDLALYNRAHPGILKEGHLGDETVLTGWHPTRPLFEKMLQWSGGGEIISLTDKPYNFPNKMKGATNSAYYRVEYSSSTNPELSKGVFYPR